MSTRFDPHARAIVVTARIRGPRADRILRLAVDTGATSSVINAAALVAVGCDPASAAERVQVVMGSGVEYVARVAVEVFEALGQERTDFPVLCHTLPPSASVHGVLGLDFFRGQRLTIDFRSGEILLDGGLPLRG